MFRSTKGLKNHHLHILFILLIGGIGVQIFTSCLSDNGGGSVSHGGQSYKTVKIGNQTWMAENLNYTPAAGNSFCYDNSTANCTKYGRLYDFETAKKVCPSGWHLPSNAEWTTLINYIGESTAAGAKLKAKNGWNDYEGVSGNGTDDYGFSALPGGYGVSDGSFSFLNVGETGDWWSSTEDGSEYIYSWSMIYFGEGVGMSFTATIYLYSVRCLQN